MFIVVLMLLAQRVSASTSSILTLGGSPRPVAVGDGADYVCSQNNINGDIQWMINNMPLEDLNLPNVQTTSLTGRGFLLFNDLSVNFNETTVQCKVNNSGTIIYSNIIKLLVQDPPSAVGSLSATTLNPSTISLTWAPSFTLNIPNPDITYCVSVEVNITASSSVTRSECDITTNAYNYTINPNEGCGFYRFTVTPMNRLGNGSAVTHTHLMESFIMSEEEQLVPVSIVEEVYTYRIVLSAPACVSGLTFVDRNTGERMNKSLITGNAIITFTTEQLRRNRYYDVTVNAINIESSATTIISTHGIENATYQMETNGTRVETDYFRNSSAIGALYIFICNGSKNMNFSYQAFNRDKSPDHILLVPNLALAYDIESDGTLYDGDGVSFPASVSSIPITGNCNGALQQIPDFITCTVTTTDKVISARCNNSDHNVTGFQMIVQNTNITDLTHVGKLMITRANDFSSLMSLQVEVSGEHLITIFSIRRGRGIINTYTPYQMRMTVDVSVTTSTLSITHPTSTTKSEVKVIAVVIPVVVLVVIIMLLLGGILVYAYFINGRRFKVKPKVRENVYDSTTAGGGYDMRPSNSTQSSVPSPLSEPVPSNHVSPSDSESSAQSSDSSPLSVTSLDPLLRNSSSNEDKEPVSICGVEGNHVIPSNSESKGDSSPLSKPIPDSLLQHPSGDEDREPVPPPGGGVEGNYVETLVSGSSVGIPITTGRSEYGEIIGEKNKQGQFYERVQVKPATTNKDKVIDFHDVNYATIDHTKHNTTTKADQQNITTPTD